MTKIERWIKIARSLALLLWTKIAKIAENT